MNAEQQGREAVAAYFARRPKFCVSMCPNYLELSETCAVAEGDMEPQACPDIIYAMKEHKHVA